MPLLPELRAVLEELEAATPPGTDEPSPEALRALHETEVATLSGSGPPTHRVKDVSAPRPDGSILTIRLYAPAPGPLPVIVYLHGGGWMVGSLDSFDALCRRLARAAGALVASVGYRLAPEHPFPAGLEDGEAALRWVATHAAELGGDAERMAVVGDSAGGGLAAVLARRARDAGAPRLRAQGLLYPALDPAMDTDSYAHLGEEYGLSRDGMAWYWDHYLGEADRTDPDVAPLRALELAGLAPALVLTAECDPLRDEGEAYAARLRAAGVGVDLRRVSGAPHGFLRWTRRTELAGQTLDAVGAGLARLLDQAAP